MCRDCGCQQANERAHMKENLDGHSIADQMNESEHKLNTEHWHDHWVEGKLVRHSHVIQSKDIVNGRSRKIILEESILKKNDQIAKENRNWFKKNRIKVLNLISSPGSGKTLLLEKTVEFLKKKSPDFKMVILTGDQEKDFDAQRLNAVGADVLQLNTVNSCHLDASMIEKELGRFVRPEHQLLIIENVGNLVCPAAFDLGETQKVALLSTTEGEDKPSKYPLLFHEAGLIVISKVDLIPYLDWSLELCQQHIRSVNISAPILKLSSKTGEGMEAWFEFLHTI